MYLVQFRPCISQYMGFNWKALMGGGSTNYKYWNDWDWSSHGVQLATDMRTTPRKTDVDGVILATTPARLASWLLTVPETMTGDADGRDPCAELSATVASSRAPTRAVEAMSVCSLVAWEHVRVISGWSIEPGAFPYAEMVREWGSARLQIDRFRWMPLGDYSNCMLGYCTLHMQAATICIVSA